jgi:hypothetical protein
MGIRKEYNDAVNALREAQAYASELEPRPGEHIGNDRMERWSAAKRLVDILQIAVDRLARALADGGDRR